MSQMSLFSFHGGVKPATHKAMSLTQPITQAPLPSRLAVPLHQNVGGAATPLVSVGQHVRKGEKIGEADGWVSAAVHAPTSGTVLAIERYPAAHPSGLSTATVLIEPDGQDRWIERQPVDHRTLPPEAVRDLLCEAGIVGMGGAVFPSHAKSQASRTAPIETLIINGAECEPYITCDDMLMRERAEEVLQGAGVFRDLLSPQRVLIGIEDNKPEAIQAMSRALEKLGKAFAEFEVRPVPTLYPAGGAKQLIRVLTGKEIPAGQRSPDAGVQCFNVATVYAAWRALAHGEPLISRLVTVTGSVAFPRNYEVLIGTPMKELLALSGPQADTDGLIMGGPMMGFEVRDLLTPVVKATNCLIAHSPSLFQERPPEMPCIRCGSCARACPHELQPFQMYWYTRAKKFDRVTDYDIKDCIECGCCAYVCPSHIPLVQYFRFAKDEIRAADQEKKAANAARERFEFKQFREEREKQDKAERLARAAAAQAAKKTAEDPLATGADNAADTALEAKKAAIAAAIARATAQHEAAGLVIRQTPPDTAERSENPSTDTPQT